MPSILGPVQLANESCLVRVSDPGALQYVDGGNVGSDPAAERRQSVLEKFQADRGHRDSVWLPISQPMYHAWRAVVGCSAATTQSMTAKQLVEALTAADALGDAETVRDVCMALRAPCHIALGLELPRALLHSDNACDQLPVHKPRRFTISWLTQVLVSLPTELATTLVRTALVPSLHLPPSTSGHSTPAMECASVAAQRPRDPPVLWFPQQLGSLSPALLPLLVQALAPSIASDSALSLDLLLFPAAHDVVSIVLPGFHHLKTLHIAFSHNSDTISDSFFERTIGDVCMLPSLEALSIKRLGRRGVCVCALAESLPNARQLSSLALNDVPLKRTAGAELVGALKGLPALARLELRDCPTDDATLTRLRRTLRVMPSIRELALHRMKLPAKLAATLVADVARLPALTVLTLDESLGAVFDGTRGGAGASGSNGSEGAYEGHSGYSGDSGDGSSIAEDAALAERLAAAIGKAAKLRELRITQSLQEEPSPPAPAGAAGPQPRAGGSAAAVSHMPLLFSDALSRHLSRCGSLTQLHLSNVVRGSCLGDILSAVPQLRSLTVQGVPLDDIAAEGAALGLRQVRKLHHLDLCHCKMSADGIQLLAAALRSCSRMRVLRLCRSGHGSPAAAALAECLPKLPLLQELDIEGWGMGPEGMRAFAPALAGTRALRVLNCAWNRIGADGTRALVRHLMAPELLSTLNLKFNCIGNTGMDELVVALRRSRSLTHLDLSGNMFGADGMRTLCAVLVSGARVGDALPTHAPALPPPAAKVLEISSRARTVQPGAGPPQLCVLGLSGCAVGMEGVDALAAVVPQLHSLRVLDFPDLLLMYKHHRAELFRVMAAMRSRNPQLRVQT